MRRGRMRRRITRCDEIAVFAAKVLHIGFYNVPGPWIGREPLKDASTLSSVSNAVSNGAETCFQ
jgi:hypothetical protein